MQFINVEKEKNLLNPYSLSFEERSQQLREYEQLEFKKVKQSHFSRWTQYNNEHTKEMMWLALKHPKAHAVLYFLVDQMDEYNAVMCSIKVLQEVLEISKSTALRALTVLKDKGFIAVLKSGTSNVYAINDSVYWKSWGNNRKYSKFPANVILSLSEQEEAVKLKNIKHKEITINE